MRYTGLFVVLTVFLLSITLLKSQPLPPGRSIFATPEQIFTENVEILSADYPAEHFYLNFDDNTRIVTYTPRADSAPLTFAYPDDALRIHQHAFFNGKYYFTMFERLPEQGQPDTWIWTLDVESGTFARLENKCPMQPFPFSAVFNIDTLINRPWQLMVEPETFKTRLCNLITGHTSEILPEDKLYTVPILDTLIPISISPDGQWLAFFACERTQQFCERTHIYGYDVANSTLIHAGFFESREKLLSFDQWVGTQVIVETSEMGEYQLRHYFIADVSRSRSVAAAFMRFRLAADFYSDPPRYEYVTGWEDHDIPSQCRWVVFNITTRTLTEQLLPPCRPDRGLPSMDVGYYRLVPNLHSSEARDTAGLIRFNPITGSFTEIYRGEIEEVIWVSDDEKFALLILDDSGEINTFPHQPSYNWGIPKNPRLVLLNLQTGEELQAIAFGQYIAFAMFDWATSISRTTFVEVLSVDEEGLLLGQLAGLEGADHYYRIMRLSFQPGIAPTMYQIDNVVHVTIDNRGVMYWMEKTDSSGVLGYYDLLAETSFPLTQKIDLARYAVRVSTIDSNHFEFNFSNQQGFERQTYVISIPKLSLDTP